MPDTPTLAPPPPEHRRISEQIVDSYPVTRRTLYVWARQGRITVWRFGGRNIYDAREFEALIQPGSSRRSA